MSQQNSLDFTPPAIVRPLAPAFCRCILVGESGQPYNPAAPMKRHNFSGSRQTFNYFVEAGQLLGRPEEIFMVAAVDAKNRLLAGVQISQGTATQSLVHPRELFRVALLASACGIIIAHNHPSGDPTPSPEDNEVTRRMKACADLMAINLVDHVICGAERYFSYADAGWPK